jgi:molybdopterin-binding protein
MLATIDNPKQFSARNYLTCHVIQIEQDIIYAEVTLLFTGGEMLIATITKKSLQNLGLEKVYFNIEKIGNTVSSSIPIAIYKLIKKKRLKKNSKILLVGFGVGLSMGATIINWR